MVEPKQIICLGLSHRTAPVDIREQFSFSGAAIDVALQAVKESSRFDEFALLSTCNRVEVYACVTSSEEEDGYTGLQDFFLRSKGVDASALEPHFYQLEGKAAAEHLCRVASGLDSIVLGEPQILGQVSSTLRASQEHDLAGPFLTALFQTAIRAGKRARAETALNRNPVSASSVAVQLATQAVGELTGLHAAVVGIGEMGRLVVKALSKRGLKTITVVNRNYEKAKQLAEQVGCEVAPLHKLPEVLASADILFSATAAEHLVIDAEIVETAMRKRTERPLALLDLAMPRDIEPAVAAYSGVFLFDIDQLRIQVETSLREREKEVPSVEVIIDDELKRFSKWLQEVRVQPVIKDLRQKAEAIRQKELERALAALQPLDQKTADQLQFLSRTLVNKLLHDPTTRLRKEAVNGQAAQYSDLVRRLFAL
ncbi:MAG: glutamyl-tRNA reductase [Rhodothermales bacterium]